MREPPSSRRRRSPPRPSARHPRSRRLDPDPRENDMKPASPLTDLPDGSFAAALPTQSAPMAAASAARWADYYELTKPRMNALVVITTAVGFYMAARGWS